MNYESVDESKLSLAVRTLILNKYILDRAARHPAYSELYCHRYGDFGLVQSYVFVIATRGLSGPEAGALKRSAQYAQAGLVVVDGGTIDGVTSLSWQEFIGRLGGAVSQADPFQDEGYSTKLLELAFNRLPEDLQGDVSDLFEEYVYAGLRFILPGMVTRYGQERRFEKMPDGIHVAHGQPMLLYDAKAYSDGYPVDVNSVRQFADYVRDFNRRYEAYIGRVHTFLVVSGMFTGDLASRSHELYAQCGTNMSFLTAAALAGIVELVLDHPRRRRAVDWNLILSRTEVTCAAVQAEMERIAKDRILEE